MTKAKVMAIVPKFWAGFFFVLMVLSVAYLHAFVLDKQAGTDDVFFSHALDDKGFREYLLFRYERWSGRLPIEAVLVLIINHMVLWKVLNSLMLLLLCFSVGRLGFGQGTGPIAATGFAYCLLLLMPSSVLWDSAWWVTGSINYLWPVALACYGALQFFDRRPYHPLRTASFVLASGLSVYNEQVALVSICILVPVHLRLLWQGRSTVMDKVHAAFMACNLMVAASAPGNLNRYLREQMTWFPDFGELTFLEKLNNGLGRVVGGMINHGNLLVLVLALVMVALLIKHKSGLLGRGLLIGGLLFISAGYLVGPVFPSGSAIAKAYSVPAISAANAAWPSVYVVMTISLCAIACLVLAQVRLREQTPAEALFSGWVLAAGLAATCAMGWSPTVHASGDRTLFVCAVLFAIMTCRAAVLFREAHGAMAMRVLGGGVLMLAAWRTFRLLF
jgi:hypothetical protein